ncbi:hypothetical protein OG589_07300 [Sphaerisporangium sp. NBC_01403]|uniref:hypothetical protein n=1 Tax=Sphaerisporangium sp. NBC_01403 TaxID=2903599 RepID=UPI00324360B2
MSDDLTPRDRPSRTSDRPSRTSGRWRAATDPPAAIRRLCVAVDVQSYSLRDNRRQLGVQAGLKRVLDRALARAGLSPAAVPRQDRGDGQLVLLPAGVDEARVIALLLREVGAGLAEINKTLVPDDRIRLRLALAQGIIHEAATGYVGKAVVDACRLVDSRDLRAALAEHDDRDLAVAVTDDLFHDVLVHGYAGLAAGDFRRVGVELADKGFSAFVWVAVPEMSRLLEISGGTPRPRRVRIAAVVGVPALLAVLGMAAWQMTGTTSPASPAGTARTSPNTQDTGTRGSGAPGTDAADPGARASGTSPAAVGGGRPFTFLDPGSVPTCGPISGVGSVPAGYDLRVFAKGGDQYFLAWATALADGTAGTWKLPELFLGRVGADGRRVKLYAVLVPSAESAELTRNFEEKWAFSSIPGRVVATHTFTVVAEPC